MKLLLTSGGLTNASIVNALRGLIGKPFEDATLAFIPTAANVEPGDKWWLIKDLTKCKELKFREVDIVDISAMPKEVWQPRLEHADVLLFGGGNVLHLLNWMRKSGLENVLPALLSTRVYVGISAGSMVLAPSLKRKEMQLLYDTPSVPVQDDAGLHLVDFLVLPHLNSPYFPRANAVVKEVAKGIDIPMYAIDDETAVRVRDGKIDVVTEGQWELFE